MNAYIFHGSTPHATADKFWYQWLAQELAKEGITAEVVDLPRLSRQTLEETLAEIKEKNLDINEKTLLIGHSAGANLMLTLLERQKKPVAKVLMVAGFSQPTTTREPTLKDNYDWDRIKKGAAEFYFVNSFNDPFNCNDHQGKVMFDHLGGKLILDNDKHYTKNKYPFFVKILL